MGLMKEGKYLDISFMSWIRAAMVVLLVMALFVLSDLLLIILTSIVIASSIEPATAWAKKRKIPRLPTVLSVYAITGLLLAGVFYFLLLPLLGEVSSFIRNLPAVSEAPAINLSSSFVPSGLTGSLPSSLSLGDLTSYLNSLANSISQGVFSSVSLIFGGVLSFILIIVLSFYLAVQEDGVGKFLKVISPFKHERYIIDVWKRSQRKIGLWMQGQILLGVLVAVITYLGLTLIGIDNALLLAVLAGMFELIPLFGPILSAIPTMFVAFAGGGMPDLLMVAGLYLIIQQFENHLLYPLVVKKVVGVPPLISIIALIIGGQLAGFLGLLISVPVATAIMELLSDYEKQKIAKFERTETA
jgi:predicted PurR-regulated permease PerM